MNITIDASNIRKGGGVTHLQEVLHAVDFKKHRIKKVNLWAPAATLDRIGQIPNMITHQHPFIEKGGWHGYVFRKWILDRNIDSTTDLLWAPGGTCISKFRPYVTMVRNFLPFDKPERDRFKYSKNWFRYLYLCHTQARSFSRADGLIHISRKTDEVINQQMDLSRVKQTTIYHGLHSDFLTEPRSQRSFEDFTQAQPVRILYVSPISLYKHQDVLLEALALLRSKGFPIRLDLVGPVSPSAKKNFEHTLARCDPQRKWVHVHGEVPYSKVREYYRNADLYACLSSCETFGMILLEAMGAGLPILCSNRSALPEINGGTCPAVDPEDVQAVEEGLERMIRDPQLRETSAQAAYVRAKSFSWHKCADETFSFLTRIAREYRNPS